MKAKINFDQRPKKRKFEDIEKNQGFLDVDGDPCIKTDDGYVCFDRKTDEIFHIESQRPEEELELIDLEITVIVK